MKTATETKHTPTPYRAKGSLIYAGSDKQPILVAAVEFADVSVDTAHATAAFFVRACNSHYDLLAACENTAASLAICQMPRLDATVADNKQIIAIALDGLRAAIAQVEEARYDNRTPNERTRT